MRRDDEVLERAVHVDLANDEGSEALGQPVRSRPRRRTEHRDARLASEEGKASANTSWGSMAAMIRCAMQNDLGKLREAAARALVQLDLVEAMRGFLELRLRLVETFGEGAPSVSKVDQTLGGILRARGDHQAAREVFERAHRANPWTWHEMVVEHLAPLEPEVLAMRPRLTVEFAGRTYAVENDSFYMGRSIERVHMYIPDDHLSFVHCRVLWEADRWVFEDCASENGCYFEGARVQRRALTEGDAIALGTQAVILRIHLG